MRQSCCSNWLQCCAGLELHHFDLYRITEAAQLGRLNFGLCFQHGVNVIEWPERLAELPPHRLDVSISVLSNVSFTPMPSPNLISSCLAGQAFFLNLAKETIAGSFVSDQHWSKQSCQSESSSIQCSALVRPSSCCMGPLLQTPL